MLLRQLKISGGGGGSTGNLFANKTETAVNRNGLYGRQAAHMSEISTTLRVGETELMLCVCECVYNDMHRLTTGIRSEKCVVRRFRRCANVIECT